MVPFRLKLVSTKTLADHVRQQPEPNDAIVAAYRSGAYRLMAIGDFFDLHYSRISKIVQATTELLEHVRDWRNAIANLKRILKPNGILLITTRSKGFDYHGYPFDFWRYEIADMEALFSDFSIETIENDPLELGVFLKAKKPASFPENNLEDYELYLIIRKKCCTNINNGSFALFKVREGRFRVLAETEAWDWIYFARSSLRLFER